MAYMGMSVAFRSSTISVGGAAADSMSTEPEPSTRSCDNAPYVHLNSRRFSLLLPASGSSSSCLPLDNATQPSEYHYSWLFGSS
jgi:hypothetical protein